MPEHDCLPLDQTAADVVATFGELSGLPARAARQRASDILDLVGLDEARFRSIGEFSTGMRQRTKLAQAIVGDPELVLLDEPTAGLDPAGRDDMLALVARLGSFGISVLMATHLLDDVQKVCDYVVMIDAGRLVVAGATDSLLERTGTVTVDVGPSGERAGRRARRREPAAPSPRTASSRSRSAATTISTCCATSSRSSSSRSTGCRRGSPRSTKCSCSRAEERVVSAGRGRAGCGLRPRLPALRRSARPARRGDLRPLQGVDATRARASGGRGGRRSRRSRCSAS